MYLFLLFHQFTYYAEFNLFPKYFYDYYIQYEQLFFLTKLEYQIYVKFSYVLIMENLAKCINSFIQIFKFNKMCIAKFV